MRIINLSIDECNRLPNQTIEFVSNNLQSRRRTFSPPFCVERNDDCSLTSAAFNLNSAGHKAGKQTATMAAQRIAFAYGRHGRLTLGSLTSHLCERLLSIVSHPK
jgi:hypothetical protein